jgi:hypothetical protein
MRQVKGPEFNLQSHKKGLNIKCKKKRLLVENRRKCIAFGLMIFLNMIPTI